MTVKELTDACADGLTDITIIKRFGRNGDASYLLRRSDERLVPYLGAEVVRYKGNCGRNTLRIEC